MKKSLSDKSRFKGLKIAITGANGSLGKSLIEVLKKEGAYLIGLTHDKKNNSNSEGSKPDEWILWSCGKERLLSSSLANIDILILNHGFNPKELIDSKEINKAIEINTLSHWRLIQIFEELALKKINEIHSIKQLGLLKVANKSFYDWHVDDYRQCCINCLVRKEHNSYCLFGEHNDKWYHDNIIELKYNPYTYYLFMK